MANPSCDTGPNCPPKDIYEEVAHNNQCINNIEDADLGDIPNLPSDVTPPEPPEISDVTEVLISGSGAFDVFMRAGSTQLQTQYDAGRIKGADFAAAYVQMMQLMMTSAIEFVLKKFETEMAGELFKSQYMKAAFEALTAQQSANKMIADAYLTKVQACELPLNSAADRILKEEQAKAQAKSVDLYDRQIQGFDDKAQESILKIIMDSWAAQGVEITATQADSVLASLNGNCLDARVLKMMEEYGIAPSGNIGTCGI